MILKPQVFFAYCWTPKPSPTATKISGFTSLPDGWHFGAGKAPSDDTVDRARSVLTVLTGLGFASTDAFPGVDGEVQLSAYWRGVVLEIIVENRPHSYSFSYEKDGVELDRQDDIAEADLAKYILSASRDIWPPTSDFFTPGSSMPVLIDSRALHSATQVTVAESRSSPFLVSQIWGTRFVNTPENSTPA